MRGDGGWVGSVGAANQDATGQAPGASARGLTVGAGRVPGAIAYRQPWPPAPLLRAHFPRAWLDVNREPYELDPAMGRAVFLEKPLP